MPQEAEAGRAAAAERPDSVTQLLVRCGPRLRALRLRGVRGVPALSYDFLRECTALTELELNEARCNPCVVNYPADPDEFNPGGSDAGHEVLPYLHRRQYRPCMGAAGLVTRIKDACDLRLAMGLAYCITRGT